MWSRKKKLRPSTASGIIQSSNIPHILDDIRPNTAIGNAKTKPVVLGLEPTFITAHRNGSGLPYNSVSTGKQVHGGVDNLSVKEKLRRYTISTMENLSLSEKYNIPKRPITAPIQSKGIKIEEKITLDDLYHIKQAFEDADKDGTGTLNMEEFKSVFKYFLGMKGADDHQITDLFMKIDSSADEEIDWDEFCTFMQLEYAEKEESYFRAKEAAFYLPARIENSPHRDTVLCICHASDNTFLSVGQDGFVSFWTPSLDFKRTKQVESGSKKSKWITDFKLMPQYNKFIISTGDREIQFHELSTFEAYCQISGLETVPLRLDYCFTGSDECLLLYGDSQGCISIFIMHNVGELLRLWKKMPKVEGIAGISIDSVCSSEHVQFVRWKVHDDWVQELKYYHSTRSVISCSTDSNYSLVIGQTVGSTNVAANIKEVGKIGGSNANIKDFNLRRRLSADETVFRIYKGVKSFDFSKIKNILATGGLDRLIRLWNPYVHTKPTGILAGHVTPIIYLFIVEEDNRLFSISTDKTVKVWDIHDQACLLTVHPKSHLVKGDLTAVHYNPVSRGLALATDHIALLRLKNKPHSMQMTTTHKEAATCCCYNKSFDHVVTASELSVIKVWDVESGNNVFEFSDAHGNTAITCLCFDTTERRLLTSGRDGLVKIWNYNNGHCLSILKTVDEDPCEVCSLVCFNINKNKYVVTVGWDRRINLYSDQQNNLYHVSNPCVRWPDDIPGRGHKEDILCVAYSPPHFLATSSYDGEILIWSVKSGRIFSRLITNSTLSESELLEGELSITKIVFLKSRCLERKAATIVANGPQDKIHFWNVYDSKQPYASFYSNYRHLISAMDVTSDDQLLITADDKGFVTVWDVSTYCFHGIETKPPEVHYTWRAHIQPITCVSMVKEDCFVLTCSSDCTVRLWTIDGHFVGTLGQPKKWDLYDKTSYQHPMAPYDVVMDPESIPDHPVLDYSEEPSMLNTNSPDDDDLIYSEKKLKDILQNSSENLDIKELLETNISAGSHFGKRLRHAKLKLLSNDVQPSQGPSTYKSLKYYELDEVPPADT